jgi:nitrite reductase/ring-hydroxylating ferredoxin subunit
MVASGCGENNQRNFPNISFEEYIYLNNPSNLPLQNVGGAVTHPGGYKGLIIYRRYFNNNNDFAAYDRGCPTHYQDNCGQLILSNDGSFAECPCEGEKYLLFDGSPSTDATISLVPYQANLNGQVIVVRN